MESARTAKASSQHQARPGRVAVVVADLADLAGPTDGTVELPIWLFWSSSDHTFDLGKPHMLRSMYEIVLGAATRPEDLCAYLDGDTLAAVWPELYLPKGVRRAWEERHPVLLDSAA